MNFVNCLFASTKHTCNSKLSRYPIKYHIETFSRAVMYGIVYATLYNSLLDSPENMHLHTVLQKKRSVSQC